MNDHTKEYDTYSSFQSSEDYRWQLLPHEEEEISEEVIKRTLEEEIPF